MILATIGAREESTHVATAPSRIRRAASGLQYIGLSEDVEESDQVRPALWAITWDTT